MLYAHNRQLLFLVTVRGCVGLFPHMLEMCYIKHITYKHACIPCTFFHGF